MMQTIAQTVAVATRTLAGHSDSPRLDAELLLGKVLNASRATLVARSEESLPEPKVRAYAELISQRCNGSPVAYLLGEREFWSMKLAVTPAVLVPRPETELLVEQALARADARAPLSVLDLGTGSGAIAVAIAGERPNWRVTAVDVSPAALEVAKRNAASHGLHAIEWREGAWFEAVPGRSFDIIVSNPPYVAGTDPRLDKLRAEPRLALSPGRTGLEALAAIISQAPRYLNPNGSLLLEHGSEQSTAVSDLLARHGYLGIRTCFDFSGKARMTAGSIPPSH
jgi:release factor glutamine methyltransferase